MVDATQVTAWGARIVNPELWARWQEAYQEIHSDAKFEHFVKQNPQNRGHYLLFGYNILKGKYYIRLNKKRKRRSAVCPFDDFDPRKDISEKRYGDRDYRLTINDFPPVLGVGLILHKDHTLMDPATKKGQRKHIEALVEVASDTGARAFSNTRWGASQAQHLHGQFDLFEVPFEFYLNNGMEGFPGVYEIYDANLSRDRERAALWSYEKKGEGIERTIFVIGNKLGIVLRKESPEAREYFGGTVAPSGNPLLGIHGSPDKQTFDKMRKAPFDEIWEYFQKTLVVTRK